MRFNVGDTLFTRNGLPGLVTDRNPTNGELQVQTKGDEVDKAKKRGYINGLNTDERTQYNKIIDEVKEIEDPKEKIMKLREKVDELSLDPTQRVLHRYLSSELAHLMNTYRFEPREYRIPEWEAK